MNKKDENVYILAVETSCDETSVSVVANGREILSNVISSQIDIHMNYGGVVPEVASRKHIEDIGFIGEKAIVLSGVNAYNMSGVAVTYGPGLVGALLVGINYAKGLSYVWDVPLIGINHIEGHICANYLTNKDLEPPFMCLVVSGGHTNIVYVEDYNKYEVLGRTRDDAAGEAYDKVARAIGLGYPGGPKIDKLAKEGNPNAIKFPRAKIDDNKLDFSFSGVKSAVLNYINQNKMKDQVINNADIAASFQESVVDVLTENVIKAAKLKKCNKIALAGGVACNSRLREKITENCKQNDISLYMPDPILCTDNAAMIGCCAYYKYKMGLFSNYSLNAFPNLDI